MALSSFTRPYVPSASTFRRILSAAIAALPLAGCDFALLDPHGPVAAGEKTILLNATAIMLVIVVPTVVATLAVAWWFRASNARARYQPTWVFSGRIELVMWSIPLLTVMFLGGVAWIGSHRLDPDAPLPAKAAPLQVEVVSLDWKWLFIYPREGIATVNQLVIPAGVPVHFRLTAGSVMNAFFAPRLGSMIYAMNGMVTRLNLMADRAGDSEGRSAHFSGDGFPAMHFAVRAMAPDEFAAWLGASRGETRVLDDDAYRALAQQTVEAQPLVFGKVAAGLFERIATQALPPGPGPPPGSARSTSAVGTEASGAR